MTEQKQPQQQVSPFASEGSPYPLLTAWYYGRLYVNWKQERERFFCEENIPTFHRAGELAAAKLAWHLGTEFVAMVEAAEKRAKEHCLDPDYTDDLLRFHDALVCDDERKYFREVLQDLSGSRTLLSDEQEYGATQEQLAKEKEVSHE